MKMEMFGLIVQTVATMSFLINVNGELTAEAVYALLSDRLDNLALETYNLKSELRDSVATMNKRIDSIQRLSESQLHKSTNSADVPRQKNKESDAKILKRTRENIHKALAMEKMFIRNVLTDYEEKLSKFQTALSDQMEVVNRTVKTSSERLERQLHEQEENINQLKTTIRQNSADQETMIAKVSRDHGITTFKLEGIRTTVNNIKDDLNSQGDRILNVNSSVIEVDSRITTELGSVQDKLSTLEDEMRVSFLYAGLQFMTNDDGKEEVFKFDIYDRLVYDEGYNNITGVFTTTKTGIYQVHCSFNKYFETKTVIALYVGGNKIVEVDDEMSSLRHTAYLSKGQEIYVTQRGDLNAFFRPELYDMIFTIILIK